MNTHGYTPEEIDEILTMERNREARHDQWCNDNEGKFTDAEGIETMANQDNFWR